MTDLHRVAIGLALFKGLIKDGCQWQGDILSKKWGEFLYVPESAVDAATFTLSLYNEGVDFMSQSHDGVLSGVYIA